MLQGEHSAILSTFIKLPFVIKIFVLSIFEWPSHTGFTVYEKIPKHINIGNIDFYPRMHELIVQCSVKYLIFHIVSFQNFLNNLKDTNVMAFVARIGLFFQMLCVFPLLVFILRLQFMNSVFGTIWPGLVFGIFFSFVYLLSVSSCL